MIVDYFSEEKKPILSVCVVTYNQKDFIRQAIDSVFSQVTNYPFEVLIGDDCSNDGTREIIEEYKANHPEVFFYFAKKNTYKSKNNVFLTLEKLSSGKYVIILEGDDYWIDKKKLDKQISYLIDHPDYLAVSSKCLVVDKDSKPKKVHYPDCSNDTYDVLDWYNCIVPGQTTTFMHVNRKLHPEIDWSITEKGLIPGDRLKYYVLALNGKIGCIKERLSAYRYVPESGISFVANDVFSYNRYHKWYQAIVEYTYKHGNKYYILLSEVLYFEFCVKCIIRKQMPFRKIFFLDYKKSGRAKIYLTFISQQIRFRIFKQKKVCKQ